MKLFRLIMLLMLCNQIVAQSHWEQNTSPSYGELMDTLKKWHRENPELELYQMGSSDAGVPIYLCIVNGAKDSILTFEKARKQTTVLINNAIHPGEPDGVNAMLLWIENWIKNGKHTQDLPVLAFIPAYNVDGMLNRNSSSRVNQNGPEEYGFRGTVRNYDLNRDFVKMDTKNAFVFASIYHSLDPDVFIDNHVSNGADYQYTLTYITALKERMSPYLQELTYSKMLPMLTKNLARRKWELFPYVDLIGETPEEGITAFNDLARYSNGYAALFHSISFTVETHMLKPFPQRVKATQAFMEETIKWVVLNQKAIEEARKKSFEWQNNQAYFKFNYERTQKAESISFKGFKATYPTSDVTGLPRLKYDELQPYQKNIPYFRNHQAADSVLIPDFYVLGNQESAVIDRLKANHIQFSTLTSDSSMKVTITKVVSFEASEKPYEGHFKMGEIKTNLTSETIQLRKGDLLIPVHQRGMNFLLQIFSSQAEDSYVSWNFFDSYLQQKEHFSSYIFIDEAQQILNANPALKKEFEDKKRNEKFRSSEWEQLNFIYERSKFHEPSERRLPVYQIFN